MTGGSSRVREDNHAGRQAGKGKLFLGLLTGTKNVLSLWLATGDATYSHELAIHPPVPPETQHPEKPTVASLQTADCCCCLLVLVGLAALLVALLAGPGAHPGTACKGASNRHHTIRNNEMQSAAVRNSQQRYPASWADNKAMSDWGSAVWGLDGIHGCGTLTTAPPTSLALPGNPPTHSTP